MIDLEELEKLAKDATPGPWRIDAENNPAHFIMTNEDIPMHRLIAISESPIATCDLSRRWTESCANAAYIVAACNAVPELIARVRELERQREALAFLLAQFLPHAECPLFDDCSLSHKKNVDVRDCAKQLIQGGLGHE